jgi:DNA-binding MarR family transcriptional regulator
MMVTMSRPTQAESVRDSFISVIAQLGLQRPDATAGGELSASETTALGALLDEGPLIQQDLADRLRLQKSSVSRLVDQLVAHGLARRGVNESDGRRVSVSLTAKGRRRAEKVAAARRDAIAPLLARLSADERRGLLQGLTRLDEVARSRES